jgi:hypothetical protein
MTADGQTQKPRRLTGARELRKTGDFIVVVIISLLLGVILLWAWLLGHWFARVLVCIILVLAFGALGGACGNGEPAAQIIFVLIGASVGWAIGSVPVWYWRGLPRLNDTERRDIARQAQLLEPHGESFLRAKGLTWADLGLEPPPPKPNLAPPWARPVPIRPEPVPPPPKSNPAPPWPYPLPPARPVVHTIEEWRATFAPEPKRIRDHWLALICFGVCAVVLAACHFWLVLA